jgi:hypothetical protein
MRFALAFSASLAVAALACSHGSKPQGAAPPTAAAAPQLAMAPPAVGSAAPRGVLEAADGTALDLAGHFEGHATVMVFYRGFW